MKCRSMITLALFLVGAITSTAMAGIPQTMSYQGVLTDGSGNPVADGSYNLGFSLYDVPTSGTALWTETHSGVTVFKGGFSVILGSTTPITLPFDATYYVGTTVNGGSEMTPRVQLTPSPYALSLRLPYSAVASDPVSLFTIQNSSGFDAIRADPGLRVGGSAPGVIRLFNDPTTETVQIYGGSVGANVLTLSNGFISTGMQIASASNNSGLFICRGGAGDGSAFCSIDGNNGGTGAPTFQIFGIGNANSTTFDTNQSGDNSVRLPAASVGPTEMWGLPGIAQNINGGPLTLTGSGGTMADIITVSITTTAAGYIVVDGAGQVSMNGSGSDTYVMLQIDETAGGGVDAVHNRSVGFNTPPNGGDYYFTGSVTRTYFKSAGTYTFRMEGTRFGSTNASMGGITIRATFFPGSYGTVNSIVSGPDGAAFDHRTPVAASSAGSGGADAYTVDLRELELKAARAEAESQRAQRELDAAQARSVRDQMQRQVHAVSAKQPAGHP